MLFSKFLALVTINETFAQYGGGFNGDILETKIEKALTKCTTFMTRSMICDPPSKKISKYIHRLELVYRDAQHHINVGKCISKRHSQVQSLITDQDDYQNVPIDMSYRRRRMLELQDELDNEYEQVLTEMSDHFQYKGKGEMTKQKEKQINQLGKICQASSNLVLDMNELADCGKLGSWTRRSEWLIQIVNKMKNLCISKAYKQQNNNY